MGVQLFFLPAFQTSNPCFEPERSLSKEVGSRHEVRGNSWQHTLARELGFEDSGDDRVWRDPALRVHIIVLLAVVLCAEISLPWPPSFQIALISFILLPGPLLSSAFPWPLCSSLVCLGSVLVQMPPYRSRPSLSRPDLVFLTPTYLKGCDPDTSTWDVLLTDLGPASLTCWHRLPGFASTRHVWWARTAS